MEISFEEFVGGKEAVYVKNILEEMTGCEYSRVIRASVVKNKKDKPVCEYCGYEFDIFETAEYLLEDGSTVYFYEKKYCPNCGAHMVGGLA